MFLGRKIEKICKFSLSLFDVGLVVNCNFLVIFSFIIRSSVIRSSVESRVYYWLFCLLKSFHSSFELILLIFVGSFIHIG